jgi:hypothetical protein
LKAHFWSNISLILHTDTIDRYLSADGLLSRVSAHHWNRAPVAFEAWYTSIEAISPPGLGKLINTHGTTSVQSDQRGSMESEKPAGGSLGSAQVKVDWQLRSWHKSPRHWLQQSTIGRFRGEQSQRLNSHSHSIGDVVFVASSSIDRLIDQSTTATITQVFCGAWSFSQQD